jgi:hypothetical protein
MNTICDQMPAELAREGARPGPIWMEHVGAVRPRRIAFAAAISWLPLLLLPIDDKIKKELRGKIFLILLIRGRHQIACKYVGHVAL